jgi:hypothetical protein
MICWRWMTRKKQTPRHRFPNHPCPGPAICGSLARTGCSAAMPQARKLSRDSSASASSGLWSLIRPTVLSSTPNGAIVQV